MPKPILWRFYYNKFVTNFTKPIVVLHFKCTVLILFIFSNCLVIDNQTSYKSYIYNKFYMLLYVIFFSFWRFHITNKTASVLCVIVDVIEYTLTYYTILKILEQITFMSSSSFGGGITWLVRYVKMNNIFGFSIYTFNVLSTFFYFRKKQIFVLDKRFKINVFITTSKHINSWIFQKK